MQKLIDLAERAAKLNESFLLNSVLKNQELVKYILDLNRQGQLFEKGIDSTGTLLSIIGGEYSPRTMDISEEKGRPKRSRDHIDLHDTGEFYASFHLTLGEQEFYIEANPLKDDTNLFTEWGEDILGLTEESKEILSKFILQYLQPALIEYLLE